MTENMSYSATGISLRLVVGLGHELDSTNESTASSRQRQKAEAMHSVSGLRHAAAAYVHNMSINLRACSIRFLLALLFDDVEVVRRS